MDKNFETDSRWNAVDGIEGTERWIQQDYAQPESAPATTNTSIAPLTRWQQAVVITGCVLGALLTAAAGLAFIFAGLQ